MKIAILALLLSGALLVGAEPAKPIKALMVTGGGFHDYTGQKKILAEGIAKRVNVEWTIVQEGETREHRMSLFEQRDWAKGYDVVVHNVCFGMVADEEFVARVAAPHRAGIPAVMLHATVHSYRHVPTDAWREVLGMKSMSHEKSREMVVKPIAAKHPVMRGFPGEWQTPKDELYKIEKIWPQAVSLAEAYGEETKQVHPVIWVHTIGDARVFTTTLGHTNEVMATDVYLDLVARGLLWACGKLTEEGKPAPGYGPGGK